MAQIIIHVDMDAFFAAVEVRDDPSLAGKPLMIGALPGERGVIATCSYEARRFGVHSAMSSAEAYRLCPHGVFRRPNFAKYAAVSRELHKIWASYADAAEYVALDEAYLDVTESAGTIERAREMAREIKKRTRAEQGLTCSVGLGYSKSAAKTASEEMKPDGYFELLTPDDFLALIDSRDVRALLGVGEKTAEKLYDSGIRTVRDVRERQETVIRKLGSHGRWLVSLACGRDERKVVPYDARDAKSVSRELTFQKDVRSPQLLRDVLLLLAGAVFRRAGKTGLYGWGVTLKITYSDLKTITRSRALPEPVEDAYTIFRVSRELFDATLTAARPAVRLIGAGIYSLAEDYVRQLALPGFERPGSLDPEQALKAEFEKLSARYGLDFYANLDKIYSGDTLHRTAEYMRRTLEES